MRNDPFGNLTDWGQVLDLLDELKDNVNLSECQHGLIRILRYKGNWRLRETVLKLLGKVQNPSKDLADQVLSIIADDNIYYDARILASNALIDLIEKMRNANTDNKYDRVQRVVQKLKSTPQPPIFEKAIDRLDSKMTYTA